MKLPTPDGPDIKYGAKSHPVFDGMPKYLKEIRNYDKVRRLILETLGGGRSHSDIASWAADPEAQRRFRERGQIIKKLGFRSMAQYMAWQKVMEEIKRKMPPEMYAKLQKE